MPSPSTHENAHPAPPAPSVVGPATTPASSATSVPGMSGPGLWTIGLGILAFQVVVVLGFATVGLSLMLRPTAG